MANQNNHTQKERAASASQSLDELALKSPQKIEPLASPPTADLTSTSFSFETPRQYTEPINKERIDKIVHPKSVEPQSPTAHSQQLIPKQWTLASLLPKSTDVFKRIINALAFILARIESLLFGRRGQAQTQRRGRIKVETSDDLFGPKTKKQKRSWLKRLLDRSP